MAGPSCSYVLLVVCSGRKALQKRCKTPFQPIWTLCSSTPPPCLHLLFKWCWKWLPGAGLKRKLDHGHPNSLRFTEIHSDSLSLLQIPSSNFNSSQSYSLSLLLVCLLIETHQISYRCTQPHSVSLRVNQSDPDSISSMLSRTDLPRFTESLSGSLRCIWFDSEFCRFAHSHPDSLKLFQIHSDSLCQHLQSHTPFQIHPNLFGLT